MQWSGGPEGVLFAPLNGSRDKIIHSQVLNFQQCETVGIRRFLIHSACGWYCDANFVILTFIHLLISLAKLLEYVGNFFMAAIYL
uniref:Uncharacterized protein n=1 Tax=Solanum tuberosum TaxID=4113 RepID=M1B660_SOLTU